MKKLTLAVLIAAALSGCASFPGGYDKPPQAQDIKAEKRDEWSDLPAVTFVQSNAGVAIRKYNDLPADLLNKRVDLSFKADMHATLSDVLLGLGAQGVRLVSRLSDETMKKPWPIRTFEGNVGALLDNISVTYNVGSEYRNGNVFLVESNKYSATLPQHKEFLDSVAKALKEMGATDVRSDVMSGKVYYSAKPESVDYIEDYLHTTSKNAAMVTLQVAVLSVSVNRDVNLGFDWAKFAVMRGTGGMRSDLTSIFNNNTSTGSTGGISNGSTTGSTGTSSGSTSGTGTSGTDTTAGTGTGSTGTGTGTTVGNVVSTAAKLGSMLSFAGADGFGFKFANNAFSLNAAIKALSTYGDARTEQNVLLGTVSGLPVKINSGDDIPYTKSVGASTAAGGATTGSATTETIKSGLKLEVVPNFDAQDGSVFTQVKVDMSTLVGFRELSAGQNLGTLSQPQMKNLNFENVGRLNAGETVIVGGITYDQLSNNYTNFPGMEKLPTGSKAQKVNRNAIYIVVRPTVVIFTPKANELNAKLQALQAQRAADSKEAR